jgi:hypothetical protein
VIVEMPAARVLCLLLSVSVNCSAVHVFVSLPVSCSVLTKNGFEQIKKKMNREGWSFKQRVRISMLIANVMLARKSDHITHTTKHRFLHHFLVDTVSIRVIHSV